MYADEEITGLYSWFDNMFALQVVAWILILFIVVGVVIKLWKPAKKFIEGMDTLFGTEEKPSLAKRLDDIEEGQAQSSRKIETIYREVLPNHGSSLRDQVDQIAKHQENNYQKLTEHINESEENKVVIEELKFHIERFKDE